MILYLLATYGIVEILGVGRIFAPLRQQLPPRLREMVECPMCLGFWVGLSLALLLYGGLISILYAFAASGFCWLMRCLAIYLNPDEYT